jgi:hypothetical protein
MLINHVLKTQLISLEAQKKISFLPHVSFGSLTSLYQCLYSVLGCLGMYCLKM